MKQKRTHKTKLKQPQNGIKLSLKSTPRNKRNKTKKKNTIWEDTCKNKTTWLNLGNEVNKKVNIFDMP